MAAAAKKLVCTVCLRTTTAKSEGWVHCRKCPGEWAVCNICNEYKLISNMHKFRAAAHRPPKEKKAPKAASEDGTVEKKEPKKPVVKRTKKTAPADKAKKERKHQQI